MKEIRSKLNQPVQRWMPIIITISYLLIGGLWILLSDQIIAVLTQDAETLSRLQSVKGLWYVGITGLLLWLALWSFTRLIDQKENKLQGSRKRYRSLFNSLHEPILVAGTDWDITDCNPALETLFGYSLGEIQGSKFSRLYKREAQFQALAAMQEEHPYPDSFTANALFQKKDRKSFPGKVTISYWKNELDELTGLIGIIEDQTPKYEAQVALAVQEEEYSRLIEQAPVGVFQTTRDGKVIDINQKMAEILGCSTKQEALEMYSELEKSLYVDPERRQEFLKQLEAQGQVTDFVYQAYQKDGSKIWISMNARVSKTADRTPAYIQGFASDITAQHRAERTLQEDEVRFRKHLERSFDGILIHRDGRVLFINQQGANLLGADSPEEIVGRDFGEFTVDEFTPDPPDQLPDQRAGHSTGLREGKLLRVDNRQIEVEMVGISAAYQGEQAVQVVFRDISQRKWMENALLEERDRAQQYLDIAGVMIAAVDASGEVIMINDTGCDLLEFHRNEIIGKDWFETFLPADHRESEREVFDRLLSGNIEEIESHHSPIRTKSGKERLIEWQHTLLTDGQHGRARILSSGNDITGKIEAEKQLQSYRNELESLVEERTRELAERVSEVETLNRALTNLLEDLQITNLKLERATKRLQEANQELESFTYSVSHDLRAPLRAITGFSQILKEEFPEELPPEGTRYLEMIQGNAEQMDTLIKDLLALSRFGRQAIQKTQFDPKPLVESIIDSLLPEETDREIEIQIEDLPTCLADPGLLKQVYINLIDNALKYTKTRQHTLIRIGAVGENGNTAYFVEDNGIGFDMEYVEKLFGTFQRLHRDEEYQGTGIGLAIVQRIIRKHGGRIWAKGQVDQGATFFFTLPLSTGEKMTKSERPVG